jgi:hypothetical protein
LVGQLTNTLPFSRSNVRTNADAAAAGLTLYDATAGRTEVTLDFSAFELNGAARQHPSPLLILANAALGVADRAPLSVVLPKEDQARLALLRSGILFAVAVSAERYRHEALVGMDPDVARQWLELWSTPWSPHEPILGRFFDELPVAVDGPEFAGPGGILKNRSNAKRATRVIIDPHPRGRDFIREQCAGKLAGGWLSAVIPGSPDTQRAMKRNVWSGVVTQRVLLEPLLNVVDHAFTRPIDGTPSLPAAPARSFVLLARTDGGGKQSNPRLHLLVADSGYGLVSTLRPKLKSSGLVSEKGIANSTSAGLLKFAIERPAKTAADPGLPWARSGFAHVVSAGHYAGSDEYEYEFTILTGDPDDGTMLVARCTSNGLIDTKSFPMPFLGTSILVTLPVPHGVETEHGGQGHKQSAKVAP